MSCAELIWSDVGLSIPASNTITVPPWRDKGEPNQKSSGEKQAVETANINIIDRIATIRFGILFPHLHFFVTSRYYTILVRIPSSILTKL